MLIIQRGRVLFGRRRIWTPLTKQSSLILRNITPCQDRSSSVSAKLAKIGSSSLEALTPSTPVQSTISRRMPSPHVPTASLQRLPPP